MRLLNKSGRLALELRGKALDVGHASAGLVSAAMCLTWANSRRSDYDSTGLVAFAVSPTPRSKSALVRRPHLPELPGWAPEGHASGCGIAGLVVEG
jgi:hypothetical protein